METSSYPRPFSLDRTALDYPDYFRARLGADAPDVLVLLGNPEILKSRKTALFCSARTPGDAILRAYDTAQRMRDEGVVVISGFHSPMEKECLRILLRGEQPIIVCPARAIETMRVPRNMQTALDAGRILVLSPFVQAPPRITRESALRRNEVVAALADDAYIAHVSANGEAERIAHLLATWRVPVLGPPTTPL